MIDERMQDQAALHVLGALDPKEAREFKAAMKADPNLQKFVARLSVASGALAGSVPKIEPPPHLRAKILARYETQQRIVSFPEPASKPSSTPWLAWAIAAALALICAVLLTKEAVQRREIDRLNEIAAQLQATNTDLRQAVTQLKDSNRMANLKIAMLNSLVVDQPKTVAVTLWDDQRQDGVFVAQNLKPLPEDKDYELWVIDGGKTPVAAGVVHADETGRARADFKPAKNIVSAGRFAVTVEKKGGVDSPTIKNLILASN